MAERVRQKPGPALVDRTTRHTAPDPAHPVSWISRLRGLRCGVPRQRRPFHRCWYCDPPAPQARREMRLRSGRTCRQPAVPLDREWPGGSRRGARARRRVEQGHVSAAETASRRGDLARSTNTVSSGLTCPRSTRARSLELSTRPAAGLPKGASAGQRQRQPSAGATYLRMLSIACAL